MAVWDRYILDGKVSRLEPDLERWTLWFETSDRRVALDKVGEIVVSTVFLGIDHGFGGPPLLFETAAFLEGEDIELERYGTWDEAVAGHARMLSEMKKRNAAAEKMSLDWMEK